MVFKKFAEFLKEKQIAEGNLDQHYSVNAVDYDRKLAEFNNRFKDMDQKEVLRILQNTKEKNGLPKWANVPAFINDPNPRKWAMIRMPGQENYT